MWDHYQLDTGSWKTNLHVKTVVKVWLVRWVLDFGNVELNGNLGHLWPWLCRASSHHSRLRLAQRPLIFVYTDLLRSRPHSAHWRRRRRQHSQFPTRRLTCHWRGQVPTSGLASSSGRNWVWPCVAVADFGAGCGEMTAGKCSPDYNHIIFIRHFHWINQWVSLARHLAASIYYQGHRPSKLVISSVSRSQE